MSISNWDTKIFFAVMSLCGDQVWLLLQVINRIIYSLCNALDVEQPVRLAITKALIKFPLETTGRNYKLHMHSNFNITNHLICVYMFSEI